MTKPKHFQLKRDYILPTGYIIPKGELLTRVNEEVYKTSSGCEFSSYFVNNNENFFEPILVFEPVIEERKKVHVYVRSIKRDWTSFCRVDAVLDGTDKELEKERILLESVLNRGRMPEKKEEYFHYSPTFDGPHCTRWDGNLYGLADYYLGNCFPIKDYPTPEDAERACQEWWDTRGKFLVEGER